MDGRTTPTGLPRTVSNPVMGVTVEFEPASDESDGEHVEARVSIPAGDKGPPPHFHTGFEETFTALESDLFMDLGDRRGIVLRPGEPVHVARNVRHRIATRVIGPPSSASPRIRAGLARWASARGSGSRPTA